MLAEVATISGMRTRTQIISSRRIFYVHAFLVAYLICASLTRIGRIVGIDPDVFVPPLLLTSVILPLVVFVVAIFEQRTWGGIAAVVALSVALTITSFYAILPMVW